MKLQKNLDQFSAAGICVFAISYDPVEALRSFADEFGITFPLLSDADHKVIEATGILNTLVRPEEKGLYGIPFPGSYVIGEDGTIQEKLFYRHYRVRPSAATVLRKGFGVEFDVLDNPHAEAAGEGVKINATLGAESMAFGETAEVYVDVTLAEGLHLYGRPVPEGYVATEITVEAPERIRVGEPAYPPTRPFRVAGVEAEFRVFEGDVRVSVPVQCDLAEGDSFGLDVSVRYQACTDSLCYLPQTRKLHLEVPIAPLNTPRQRR